MTSEQRDARIAEILASTDYDLIETLERCIRRYGVDSIEVARLLGD